VRRRVEITVLQLVLTGLGLAMSVASRRVVRFRRQVSRDLVVEIRTADGVRQQYRFVAATRRMHAPLRRRLEPEVTLRFGSARDGLRTLLSPRAVGRLVEGMNRGATRIDGNPVLILWFWGMTRIVAPIGVTRRPRRPGPFPVRDGDGTTEPYAARIVREPPVRELARDWPAAWAAREKLLHARGAEGARLPPG
jgi:hypothetical protein